MGDRYDFWLGKSYIRHREVPSLSDSEAFRTDRDSRFANAVVQLANSGLKRGVCPNAFSKSMPGFGDGAVRRDCGCARHGICFCGSLSPGAAPTIIRTVRSAALPEGRRPKHLPREGLDALAEGIGGSTRRTHGWRSFGETFPGLTNDSPIT